MLVCAAAGIAPAHSSATVTAAGVMTKLNLDMGISGVLGRAGDMAGVEGRR